MSDHKTFRFTEIYLRLDADDNPEECGRAVFLVNTRRLSAFIAMNDFAYNYVESLIERAIKGHTDQCTSHKYSFGDMPAEYVQLAPGKDCDDPIVDITVEVG